MSSGTIGAALSSTLSGVRSIALSFGIMSERILTTFHDPAFKLSTQIINNLLRNWKSYGTGVLYSINIPMIEKLLHDDGLKIYWTSVWKSNYKRLFKEVPGLVDNDASGDEGNLVFKFQPDLTGLLSQTSAPEGSDSWALEQGAASVTPLLTSFAELPESEHSFPCLQDREWKYKL
jgi:tubulin--tyrosine ligase